MNEDLESFPHRAGRRALENADLIAEAARLLSAAAISLDELLQESLANAKVNARQHCVVRSH